MNYQCIEKELLSIFREHNSRIYFNNKSYYYKFYNFNYGYNEKEPYMLVEKYTKFLDSYSLSPKNTWYFHANKEESITLKNYLAFREIFTEDRMHELLEDRHCIL